MHATESLWTSTADKPAFPRFEQDELHVDVAVIGAGITGVTAGLLLKEAGKRVAVLDARAVGMGVTGCTTAHITEALDTRYYELEKKFGRDGAEMAAESSRAAINRIAGLVRKYAIDCSFERLPGYLFASKNSQKSELERELDACRRLHIRADMALPDLPVPVVLAITFPDQAQFHPYAYVSALARRIAGEGSYVFEASRILAVDEGEPCRLHAENGASLTADRVVVATHAPLNKVLLQTKIARYRSYAISGPVERAPHGLFWDLDDPYHYIRAHRAGNAVRLIIGGADHKTGQESHTEARFESLATYAKQFGLKSLAHRWSGQIIEPVDGLPYIGVNAKSRRTYVATGYSGNGMTFGTLAAMILTDYCLDRKHPFADLYSAKRFKPLASLASYVSENIDFPIHLVGDAIRPPEVRSVDDIPKGEGAIVRVLGERLAVFRDESGQLHALSPICTHLGCHVSFNGAEKTWDCPCHGSRFTTDGEVVNGPALKGLRRRSI